MDNIEIEIDGRKLSAKPNQTIIEVADLAGIYIPRFCYHKHLSVAANCRMCLVEVEKSPKTLPACATPVLPGMKVFTQSPKTLEAQRAVMEFLLINHPLDCPVCDQGGECELQDVSMGYGSSWSHYDECKRAVADENLGPLIETEMTRCILCTRCVRFGDEIAGMRELGVTRRGEDAEISTYVQKTIVSEVSGNIIDICPVGALTSKPYRFTARAWELDQAPSISPHDCMGSNLNVHSRYGTVMRVVARENNAINETWISDRDRFSYTGLYHADRLGKPLAKINGKWEVVEWQKAFQLAASGLQEIVHQFGGNELGSLVSPNSTVEEFYLLQKITRGLGSQHIDHRLREIDTRDQALMPAFPCLAMPIAEIEQCDAILLIGSNLQKEQPLAALRVRKAVKNNAVILAVNPVDYLFNFKVTAKNIIAPHHLVKALTDIHHALEKNTAHPISDHLKEKKKICILLGALAQHHPEAAVIRALAQSIAMLTGGKLHIMTDGANGAGGWIAGAVPHREPGNVAIQAQGLSAYEMLAKPRKAYLLLNVEPELDCANAAIAQKALEAAHFVVAFSMYRNPVLEEQADVIFPITPFTETSGTFINVTGLWQSFNGVAKSFEASRPAWKVLRVLGHFLQLKGFDYESSHDVIRELKNILEANTLVPSVNTLQTSLLKTIEEKSSDTLSRIGEIPIYALDSLVRRSVPLQLTQQVMEGNVANVRLHPKTAKKLNLLAAEKVKVKQQTGEVILPVCMDERIPQDAVWIAGGIDATVKLGDLFGSVEINKV